MRAKLTPELLQPLVDETLVPAASWQALSVGWADAADLAALRVGGADWRDRPPDGALVFPERDGRGRVVGLRCRATDGRVGFPAGARRGLIVPAGLHGMPSSAPALVVASAPDAAACAVLGLPAVARPQTAGEAAQIAELLDGREVLVVGVNDHTREGAWPGRDRAKTTAQRVAGIRSEPVKWTLPPPDAASLHAWMTAKIAAGLDLANTDAVGHARDDLVAALLATARTAKPQRRTTADALADLASRLYRFSVTPDDEPYAVALDGSNVALFFGSRGGSKLRTSLARAYREETGRTPGAAALTDALNVLEGVARDANPEPAALRLAEADGEIVIDLGDASGRAVRVHPGGWELLERSPVLFRRTALTGALPEPVQTHDTAALLALRSTVNVRADDWPLVVGWLVAALIPDIPHPILLLGGEQGVGKSFTANLLARLVDPGPGRTVTHSQPRDPEQWAVAAFGSWVVTIDNISAIPGWFSDALCKAATGDGWVKRRLYTDSDIVLLAFRRCIVITSIDPGAIRGDLGDRLLRIDLERIDDAQRKAESELCSAFEAALPGISGALLTAIARTLAALPNVKLDHLPRLADFARVLAALDEACPELTNGQALARFMAQRDELSRDVVGDDPVGVAVLRLAESCPSWYGTATAMLDKLAGLVAPAENQRDWPRSPRALAARLKRLAPAIRSAGVEVSSSRAPGGNRDRLYTLTRAGTEGTQPWDGSGGDRPGNRPGATKSDTYTYGVRDGRDGSAQTLFDGSTARAEGGIVADDDHGPLPDHDPRHHGDSDPDWVDV